MTERGSIPKQISLYMAAMGARGGLARVSKGFAKQTPERRREIALLGVAARRKKRDA